MKAKRFTRQALLATAGAAAAAWGAVASIRLGGLFPSGWKAADVIRESCPLRLVRPEWITGSSEDEMLFGWAIAETRARLMTVGALWLLAIALLAWRALRNRYSGQTA